MELVALPDVIRPSPFGPPLGRLRTAARSGGDYRLISADRLLALTASTAADTEMPP